ncbi:cadherin-15 [Corythoichthys intestinalis]|uniref:cadherin-15 n=1 Tax=Corythoichthys intestinalis TaxID=161448 RepID=UPI0025A64EF3|nr:cadherin-15 [Corythoichthys intestinalis]XP_061796174.1 cadherin-15-like [Nerophis lumbriciformis]
MARRMLVSCVLAVMICQVWSADQPRNIQEIHPWRTQGKGVVARVKRDWIIPPIRVLENSKHVPENLVQIKSDKIFKGEVIYKLEGPGVDQAPKNFFEIDDKTGVIRSKRPLDREKYNTFTLKAFALSPSGERLENPTTIEIVVLDQNDNRPAFTQKQFTGAVSEFSVPGTSVMSVSAIDADDPMTENAFLSYSIIGQESIPANAVTKTMFGINNVTGTIYTRDVGLDREVVKSFRLLLQVADMGGMGLTGEGVAIIHIADINNHAPQFNPSSYSMTAVENRINYEIGRVNVTDNDDRGTGNWEATYFISNDPYRKFAVTTDSITNQGILMVVKPLDYETQNEYILFLTVENVNPLSDKAPNMPVSSAAVVITVVNENEAPHFREDPIHIVVPESVAPGTLLKSNIAFDPDNSDLRYEISRDPERWLDINRHTGDITAKRTFNMRSQHVQNNIYIATVKVTDVGGVSTTANVAITLKEINDFPPNLFPLSGTVCNDARRVGTGLVLTAEDGDLPPHAAPFFFEIFDEDSLNWTVTQVNDTHAILQPLVELEDGEYPVTILVSDSGNPILSAYTKINVTLCLCDSFGDCKSEVEAVFGSSMGINLIALIIIMASIGFLVLLLFLAAVIHSCGRRHHIKKGSGLLVGESEDDVRDNVLNYNEQGGGEEDENAFNIDLLWNPFDVPLTPMPYYPVSGVPRGKQPVRRDAPHNLPSPTYPRRPPADPTDIEEYISDGLDAADKDPNVPPYDTALIYDYEGEGSLAGSLSSIASGSSDEDQDYDYLNDWGPRFQKLANMYDPR